MSKVFINKKTDSIQQFLFNKIVNEYNVIHHDICFFDSTDNRPIAVFKKNFLSPTEYDILSRHVVSLDYSKLSSYKYQSDIDPCISNISNKIHVINNCYNENLVDNFTTINVFNNYAADIHRDSFVYNIKNLLVVKSDNITALTVFPEYKIAFDIQPTDLLLFDTSLLHYVASNKMVSKLNYRYPLFFE